MAALAQIYDWFMTGKKPTQAQFWASWGSFWHKEEGIPQSAITDLSVVLNAKTENNQFNEHKEDTNAHAALFAKTKVVAIGELLIFKRGTDTPTELEPLDLVMGFVEGQFITAIYIGGDKTLPASYMILNSQEF